jgi:integrase
MRVRLKGINRVTKLLASGSRVTYYYAWKGGPRLEGEPGSPEFIASFNAAVAHRSRPRDDQFQSLIDKYVASPEFTKLAASTRKDYTWHIKVIEREFGDLPIKMLDRRVRPDFMAWRDRVAERSLRQADFGIAVLARIISWAYDRGLAPGNPVEKHGRLYRSTRSDKVWTDEQEAAFYEKAPAHLHLPLMLALWTGQRQADLLHLTWADYDGTYIRLKQRKTGARVEVPVGSALRAALDTTKAALQLDDAEARSLPILLNRSGAKWSQSGFSASWRKACTEAGVVGVTFHDLRGTAVTRLARAGCTVPEIASISGHSLKDVGDILDAHYLNRDSALAQAAIRKLEANAPNHAPNRDLNDNPEPENFREKQWWTH